MNGLLERGPSGQSRARALFPVFIVALLAGCRQKPPAPGGGSHAVTGIQIRTCKPGTTQPVEVPKTVRVGDRLDLTVWVSWAIPSMGPATESAALTVSDPAVGEIDSKGVFKAKAKGKIVISAVVRVSESGTGELVAPGKPVGSAPESTFKDSVELTVTE